MGPAGFLCAGCQRPAMRRAAVLLAALLALAPVAAVWSAPAASGGTEPADAPAPVVAPERNTSEYLALPEGSAEVSRVGSVTLDVGGALAADTGAIHGEFEQGRVRAAYANASSAEERRRVLRTAADEVASSIDALVRRERRARGRYTDGELTTREYLRELAIVSARARTLEGLVDDLASLNGETAETPLSYERLGRLQSRLVGLAGPVRGLVRGVMTGSVDRVRVFVAAGSDGVVLAAVNPNRGIYLREAFVASARAPRAPDQYDHQPGQAFSRVGELYPWTFNNSQGLSLQPILPDSGVYRIRLRYDHGRVLAYLDGGSDQVFYESQRKTLSEVPTHGTTTVTDGGIELVVNRTRPGGPVQVRVREDLTGTPVDAAVTIDGVSVGRTGADGTLWTVTPPSRFTVTAATTGGNASVTVSPSP